MKRLSPVIVLLLFASCSFKSESSLSTALDLAGNNRHEIQKSWITTALLATALNAVLRNI